MKYRSLLALAIAIVLVMACGEQKYNGTCTVSGVINNYKRMKLALFEITPSQNYLISRIEVSSSGKFKVKFKAKEKSIYGITNGVNFIYLVNDVPELRIETSEDELENYIVEDSPETEQLKQVVSSYKKLATEVTLAERMLISKMVKNSWTFGSDPQMLDLENKADKRTLELRNYITTYMDTVHDKLLAIAASSLLPMNENFNYLEIFYSKIKGANICQKQKEDLNIELNKVRRSFKSITPLTQIKAIGRDGKPMLLDDLQGKYIFVNIWATWCYLSRTQVPYIRSAYQKYSNNPNVQFVNIAIDDRLRAWNDFLEKESYGIKYSLCDTLGKEAAILKRFGLEYIPANFLLDRQGNIITSNMYDSNIEVTLDSIVKIPGK